MQPTMPRKATILVVEDDKSVQDAIASYLAHHGYAVATASDADEMDRLLANGTPDAIVLDVMLPGEDGLSICRRLSGVPVLMISAMGSASDRVVGLEVGAWDYLAKPFDPRELLARIRALLRRPAPIETSRPSVYQFSGLRFDPSSASLSCLDEREIPLTSGQARLLEAFVKNPKRVLNRDRLLDLTHSVIDGPFDRAVDLAVSRLRRKLNPHCSPNPIETVRGLGYRFAAPVELL